MNDAVTNLFEACTPEKCERVQKASELFEQAQIIRNRLKEVESGGAVKFTGDLAAYADIIADFSIAVLGNLATIKPEEEQERLRQDALTTRSIGRLSQYSTESSPARALACLDDCLHELNKVLINYQALLDNGFDAQFPQVNQSRSKA